MENANVKTILEDGINSSHNTEPKETFDLIRKTDKLTEKERLSLKRHEETLEKGFKSFWEVGRALVEIRDRKLYKEKHLTFEFYLRDRWNLGKSHAYRYISAAKMLATLSPIGETPKLLPESESQIRSLCGLKPSDARVAWNNCIATAGGKPVTATIVEAEVAKLKAHKPAKPKSDATVNDESTVVSFDEEHDVAFMNMDAALQDLKKVKRLDASQRKDWTKLLKDIVAKLETLDVTLE